MKRLFKVLAVLVGIPAVLLVAYGYGLSLEMDRTRSLCQSVKSGDIADPVITRLAATPDLRTRGLEEARGAAGRKLWVFYSNRFPHVAPASCIVEQTDGRISTVTLDDK